MRIEGNSLGKPFYEATTRIVAPTAIVRIGRFCEGQILSDAGTGRIIQPRLLRWKMIFMLNPPRFVIGV